MTGNDTATIQQEEAPPKDSNEVCVGPTSAAAGKSASCAGCPNAKLCASGAPAVKDNTPSLVASRLAAVSNKILVLSGKGGVGKSTVANMIANALSVDEGCNIGLLDTDLTGPSIPRMCGALDEQVHASNSGWSPVYVKENLAVMSIGFMLKNNSDAVIWRGPKKNGLINQFLKDVEWGTLDALIIDTPPGTSDEHLTLVSALKEAGISGAVVVTGPSEMSLLDVRKEISFCKKVGIPVIGVVENMSGFVCPKCDHESIVFPAHTGGGKKMAEEMDVAYLGGIPLDPRIARAGDEGVEFLEKFPESKSAEAYMDIITKIKACVGMK